MALDPTGSALAAACGCSRRGNGGKRLSREDAGPGREGAGGAVPRTPACPQRRVGVGRGRGCGTPRTSRRPNPPLDRPEMDDGMLSMLSNAIALRVVCR